MYVKTEKSFEIFGYGIGLRSIIIALNLTFVVLFKLNLMI